MPWWNPGDEAKMESRFIGQAGGALSQPGELLNPLHTSIDLLRMQLEAETRKLSRLRSGLSLDGYADNPG